MKSFRHGKSNSILSSRTAKTVLTIIAIFVAIILLKPVGDGAAMTRRPLQAANLWSVGMETGGASMTGKWRMSCKQGSGSNRVLVTGAAGFIGFHVAKALKEKGEGVVGLDNFNHYYPVSLKMARAEELRKLEVQVVVANLTDVGILESIFEECKITHVVHLAAQAGVRYAKEKPMTYVSSNVDGTVAIFETARKMKPSPIVVYASSSSVYGANKKVPFSEEDPVDNPVSLYAATKRSVELMAKVYHGLYGLSLTGLRFFTVYGPWGRPDMAIYSFARKMVEGKTLKIFTAGDGGELARDFTYIDDIVSGILGALYSSTPSLVGQANNRIYNLGNTQPVTVSECVTALESALRKTAIKEKVVLGNTGDVLFTHANISSAHGAFGYLPSTSLNEGLIRFSEWFYEYYGPDGLNIREDELNYVPS